MSEDKQIPEAGNLASAGVGNVIKIDDRGGQRAAAMYTLIVTAKVNGMPGSPTCSPASQGIRPRNSATCFHGTAVIGGAKLTRGAERI